MDIIDRIPELVRELYSIVDQLEKDFPGRRFTLDGHLVGSIGEVLAAHIYGLELYSASAERHDASTRDGREVQIKATQRSKVGLRGEPEHLIVLRIGPDGNTEEIYNGPGNGPWKSAGEKQRNGQCYISFKRLRELMLKVPASQQLPKA